MLRESAFADVIVSCGIRGNQMNDASNSTSGSSLCYVRSDLPFPIKGNIQISVTRFSDAAASSLAAFEYSLPAGAASIGFFCPDDTQIHPEAPTCEELSNLLGNMGCEGGSHSLGGCAVNATWSYTSPSQKTPRSFGSILPLASPHNFGLVPATLTVTVLPHKQEDSNPVIEVSCKSAGVAAYVWLSTRAHGRFSTNGFFMGNGVKHVNFVPFGALDLPTLTHSIRVEHLQQHLSTSM